MVVELFFVIRDVYLITFCTQLLITALRKTQSQSELLKILGWYKHLWLQKNTRKLCMWSFWGFVRF